MQEFYSVMSVE